MSKTQINYTSHESLSDDGPWTVYFFYPDGVWDEDKLTLKEAEAKYPPKKFDWVKIEDEEDDEPRHHSRRHSRKHSRSR